MAYLFEDPEIKEAAQKLLTLIRQKANGARRFVPYPHHCDTDCMLIEASNELALVLDLKRLIEKGEEDGFSGKEFS